MSGYLGDLSDEQARRLEQFRQNLGDILKKEHDDHCLLRFLRARSFNLKESENMFRKTVSWRKTMKADDIYKTFKIPEVCLQYWCGGFVGNDKAGSTVYIAPLGPFDLKGLMHSCKTSDLIKLNIYYLEYVYDDLKKQSEKLGRNVEGLVCIYDFEGVGVHHLWKPGIDHLNKNLVLFEQFYPETVKTVYIINPPGIFPIIYSLMRPFLRERTRHKIQVLGSNWKEILLQHIDADTLPEHWGGTRRDPDGNPKCPSLVKPAGTVPQSWYMKDMRVDMQDTTTITVARGSSEQLKYTAEKQNSVLRYEFMTKRNNINFGVTWVKDGLTDPDQTTDSIVLPIQRYHSHLVPESGELELDQPGTYVVTFDNTFSLFTSKTVTFCIQILEGKSGNDGENEIGAGGCMVDEAS